MKPLHRNAILLCLLLAVFAPTTAHAYTPRQRKVRRIISTELRKLHVSKANRRAALKLADQPKE